MKSKSKITFLFCFLISFSSFVFGQKKLDTGLKLGVFQGVSAERYSVRLSANMGQAIISSLDYAPSLLAGVVVATPFNQRNHQFRVGFDLYSFHYTLATSFFNQTKDIINQTKTTNSVIQLPFGYAKKWGHFMLYAGSGVAFFQTKDNTKEDEKAFLEPIHLAFVEKTLSNFKKNYLIYECSLGWKVRQSSVEIGYRGTGNVRKTSVMPVALRDSRGIVFLATTFFLN
jgi:hypothetical protein